MELRHLRYFVAVADQGGFSGAARLLHVAQSAISEQLANLESEIDVELFLRSPRKTVLTTAGEEFLKEARRLLAGADHAIEVAQRVHRGEAGTIRVGFFAGGTGINFPHLIQSFRKHHPGVRLSMVEMTTTQQWTALTEGKIDIGFTRRLEPEFHSELRSVVMHQDPIMAILPKHHRAVPGPVDMRDLATENFVLSSREVSPAVFDKVIALCSEAGFSPRIASISTVWSSVALMVQAGEGISLLPVNEQQYRTRDLAFCPLKSRNAFVEFVMAWSPARDNSLIRGFRQMALSHRKGSQTRARSA